MLSKLYAETSQGNVRYWQSSGTGPTIVFLPGNSCNGREFKRQLDSHLGETFRCLALDINPVRGKHDFTAVHPNEDCSMMQKSAYVALEILSQLNINAQDVVFFGHGYGADVAMQIAAWQEEKREPVKGVIAAGYAAVENSMAGIAAGYHFSHEVSEALSKEMLTEADGKLYAEKVGFNPDDEEEKFAVKAAFKTDGKYRAEMFKTFEKSLNEKQFVEKTATRIAILFGSLDPNVNSDYLHSLKNELGHLTIKTIEGAPQVSFWTHAHEVNNFIENFIKTS